MSFCLYCNRPGHTSYQCWSKNKYLKEIRRNENGKLTKRYCPAYSTSNNSDFDENERKQAKEKPRTRARSPKDNKVKSKSGPEKQTVILKAKPTRKLIQENEIQIVQEVQNKRPPKPLDTQQAVLSGYQKCKECIKWEIRLQHVMKEKDETDFNNKKIIKSLTEETMKLRRERECWKTLYQSKN